MRFALLRTETAEDGVKYFTFVLEGEMVTIELMFYNYKSSFKTEWTNLISDMEAHEFGQLTFDDCNGSAPIMTKDGFTTFRVDRHGGNGAGRITVKMHNALCLPAFKEAVAQL